VLTNADERSRSILADAQQRADDLVGDAEERLAEITRERDAVADYFENLRGMIGQVGGGTPE
jgi:vacuolar-type H+-ATPase subunit H